MLDRTSHAVAGDAMQGIAQPVPERRRLLHALLGGASATVAAALPASLCAQSSAAAAAAPAPARALVRMPGELQIGQRPASYVEDVLELLLDRAGYAHRTQFVPGMTVPRTLQELRKGQVDVCALSSNTATIDGVTPLRQPIFRGLLGVRVLLARREQVAELVRVPDLATLKSRYRYGSGADWVDNKALSDLGFRLVTGPSYPGLFDMLRRGRFDYLSRAVTEAYKELDDPHLGEGLAVVPGIALAYPLDSYFFVSDRNSTLMQALQLGMQRARQDGSLNRLLYGHFGVSLQRAQLPTRRWWRIEGYPVLPGTPIDLFDLAHPEAASRLGDGRKA
ncbi:MAG TPA: hypothetical protein VFK82_10500 [Burkholderiaceae bacterium]|nr:hypothetical protein [Burkholderiaceae bacterium]